MSRFSVDFQQHIYSHLDSNFHPFKIHKFMICNELNVCLDLRSNLRVAEVYSTLEKCMFEQTESKPTMFCYWEFV